MLKSSKANLKPVSEDMFLDYINVNVGSVVCGVPTDQDIISQAGSTQPVITSGDEEEGDINTSAAVCCKVVARWNTARFDEGEEEAFLYIRPLDKEVVVIAFKNKRQIAVAGIFKHQIVEMPY